MTLEEAFAELGIDAGAGSDGARRAYLRLLKTRKPETDPEGFMRLRAAYELVKADLSLFEAFRAREPAAPYLSITAIEAPAAAVEEPPAVVVETAPVVEVVEEPPATAEPAVAAVEPAVAAVEPPAVSEASAEDTEAQVDPGDVDLMEALVARSAYQKAATQALLILAAATHRLDQRDPPVLLLLRLMLGLHRISELEKAREVSKAFKAWLAATGKESTQIRGHAAVLWTLVRELDGMKKGLPDSVRTAIALAVLAGDLTEATPDLARFRRKQPSAAEAAGGLLRRKAPVIAAALASTLDPPDEVAAPRARTPAYQRSEGSKKGFWFLPMLALGLLRLILAAGRSSPTYSSYPSYESRPSYESPSLTYPTLSFDAGALTASMNALERTTLLSRARQIVRDGTSSGRISYRANLVVAALDADNCSAALVAGVELSAEAVKSKKTIPPVLAADLVVFNAALHRYCGNLSPDPDPDVEPPSEATSEAKKDAGARDAIRSGKTVK